MYIVAIGPIAQKPMENIVLNFIIMLDKCYTKREITIAMRN